MTRWKVVTIEADLGDKMAIADGLGESELVVTMPSEKLADGLNSRPRSQRSRD